MSMTREEAEALSKRRPMACVKAWPECYSGDYDPRCCRFPKSCSPWIYPEAFVAGNATEADVEPTAEPRRKDRPVTTHEAPRLPSPRVGADRWDAPLPRYATTVRDNRVRRVRCVCDERDMCFFHAVQRDGLPTAEPSPRVGA